MIVSKAAAEGLLGKRLKGLGAGARSYYVLSADGSKNLGGPYTQEQAAQRLRQVEYFKRNPPKAAEIAAATAASPLDEIALAAITNPTLYIAHVEPARRIARRALDRRRDLPKSKRGGLDPLEAAEEGVGSGVLRARDIAAGKRIDELFPAQVAASPSAIYLEFFQTNKATGGRKGIVGLKLTRWKS